jgi:uncharacterized lipoprotein NlpE involved in copper resistance
MKTAHALPLLALLAAGCATPPPPPAPPANPMAQQTTYKGTLPCADCSGIENQLVLYRDQNGQPTRYQLTQNYIGGKSNLTVIDRGDWKIMPDSQKQAQGLDEIYVLSPEDPNSRRLFLHNAANAIELLDQEGSRIDSKLNYTLLQSQ